MSKKRRTWSPVETLFMKSRAGRTRVRTIAKRLRRSEGAVRQKAFSMGLSLEMRAVMLAA